MMTRSTDAIVSVCTIPPPAVSVETGAEVTVAMVTELAPASSVAVSVAVAMGTELAPPAESVAALAVTIPVLAGSVVLRPVTVLGSAVAVAGEPSGDTDISCRACEGYDRVREV